MRQVKCTLPAGAVIEVRTREFARAIGAGDVIDLDRVIAPAVPDTKDEPGRAAVTYADALGHHVAEAFAPVDPVKPSRAAAARAEE